MELYPFSPVFLHGVGRENSLFYNWRHFQFQYDNIYLFLHTLLSLFIRVEVWHLLVCYVHCGTYWCAICSVVSIGVPCAVWHLLMCHMQCEIYWCATCSVASIGLSFATNFNLTCFRTRFAIPLQVLLLLYFNNFLPVSLYTTHWERKMEQMACMSQCRLSQFFFSRNCHELFLEKPKKFPKFLRYGSQ